MKTETGEQKSHWRNRGNIMVLNYNTSYQASIACEPSRVFQGRFPYNVLDIKMGIRPHLPPIPTRQIAKNVLAQTKVIYQDVRKNAMHAFIKDQAY